MAVDSNIVFLPHNLLGGKTNGFHMIQDRDENMH